jgi:hypothetical protein
VLREIAEYPNSFGPLGPGEERIETERYTLYIGLGKAWNTVQRQHFHADEVAEVIEEVRSSLRTRGRGKTHWEVGSTAEPPGLVDLLLECGLVRDKDPCAVALVLAKAPPPPAPGIEARAVETFEEFAAATEVQWQAFETPEHEVVEGRALLGRLWREAPSISTLFGLRARSSARERARRHPRASCSTAARLSRRHAVAAPTARSCAPAGIRLRLSVRRR